MTRSRSLAMVVGAGIGLAWLLAGSSRAEDGSGAVTQPAIASVEKAEISSAPAATLASPVSPTNPAPNTADAASVVRKAVVEIEATADDLKRLTAAERRKWNKAVAMFPGFCQDWDRMLHDRELNNLSNLQWQEKSGYETAVYTGYGKVDGCRAKESVEGVPIGKVTYDEIRYYLTGKSIDDAKAHPQQVGKTQTLEIFSFEKDRWFY